MTINIKITSDETIEHEGKQYRPVAIRLAEEGEWYLEEDRTPKRSTRNFRHFPAVILEEVIPPYRTPTDEDAKQRPMAEFWDVDDDIARFRGTLVAVKREGARRRFVSMDIATCGLSTWIRCRIPNEPKQGDAT